MYLMWKQGNCSLSTIGMYWGGREHTTTISARDRIQDLIDSRDPIVLEKLRLLNVVYSNNSKPSNYSAQKHGKA